MMAVGTILFAILWADKACHDFKSLILEKEIICLTHLFFSKNHLRNCFGFVSLWSLVIFFKEINLISLQELPSDCFTETDPDPVRFVVCMSSSWFPDPPSNVCATCGNGTQQHGGYYGKSSFARVLCRRNVWIHYFWELEHRAFPSALQCTEELKLMRPKSRPFFHDSTRKRPHTDWNSQHSTRACAIISHN